MTARTIRTARTMAATAALGAAFGLIAASPGTALTLEARPAPVLAMTSQASAPAAPQVAPATGPAAKPATKTSAPNLLTYTPPKRLNGAPMTNAFGDHPNGPTAAGAQVCDPPNADAPLAEHRLNWMYYDPANDTTGPSTDLTISSWADAATAFKDIRRNTGLCVLAGDHAPARWAGADAKSHLLLTSTDPLPQATAVIRVGRVIVAVTVTDWSRNMDEVAAAKASAEKVAKSFR